MAFDAEHLLAKLTTFLEEVERGYDLSIYDYTNDLSARDSLEAFSTASRGNAAAVLAAIHHFDERFRAATREVDSAIPGAPEQARWWWHRVPLELTGELAEDLRSLGA